MTTEMTPEMYIRMLLGELDRRKPHKSCDKSHAITVRDGGICILLSAGDLRARVYLDGLDPDPVRAVETILKEWGRLMAEPKRIEYEE